MGKLGSCVLYGSVIALCLSIGLPAQVAPDGQGKLSPAFAKQLLPFLHDVDALKPGGSYSSAMKSEIHTLDQLAHKTDEKALMAFAKDELMRFIEAEKRPSQTAKRKKCVQELTTHAGDLQYVETKTCGDISNSMYQ